MLDGISGEGVRLGSGVRNLCFSHGVLVTWEGTR
jgi:hypothetical protein